MKIGSKQLIADRISTMAEMNAVQRESGSESRVQQRQKRRDAALIPQSDAGLNSTLIARTRPGSRAATRGVALVFHSAEQFSGLALDFYQRKAQPAAGSEEWKEAQWVDRCVKLRVGQYELHIYQRSCLSCGLTPCPGECKTEAQVFRDQPE